MKRPQKDTAESVRKVGRRAILMGSVQLGVMGILGWRMHQMQVEEADAFRLLAEENRIKFELLPPNRGLIYDRAGKVLADNQQHYRITILREDAGDVRAALDRLASVVPLDADTIERTVEEAERRSPLLPVTVLERVTWDIISRVQLNAPALPGITAGVGLSRIYPMGAVTAHVVGYVGPVSDYDLSQIEDPEPVLEIPKFQIGKTGVESKMEDDLRGSAGTLQVEVNARGRVMRELDRQEGIPGADLQLGLDADLQRYCEARLEGESASIVVIDTQTGDLRAIASAPSFDPNKFVRGITNEDWQGLNENDRRPLASKAVQDTYPPGSTFKMVVLMAALEDGVITPEETIRCNGYIEIGSSRFHCWKSGGHGNINVNESLKQSCDVYYYEVAQRVGIDKIAAMARRMGLGVRHDVPMSAVVPGIAPDREWKQRERGEDWRIGDTVNAGIGQGYVLASPLQLAVMTARLATGREVNPRLIYRINGVEQPSGLGPSLGLNENFLMRTRQSMYDVVNHNRGTAYRARFDADGMKMAGKTGTSQVRRITTEERARGVISNEDLPWSRRDHALWVNFAPFDNPRYAVSVVVEHGGGGSTAAAPIGRDVTLQALYGGAPPLEAYPSEVRGTIRTQQERIAGWTADGTATAERA